MYLASTELSWADQAETNTNAFAGIYLDLSTH